MISAGFAVEVNVLIKSAVIVGEIEADAWRRFITLLKSPSLDSYKASIVSSENKDLPDYGNMSLTLLEGNKSWATPSSSKDIDYNLSEIRGSEKKIAETRLGINLTGVIGKEVIGIEETPKQGEDRSNIAQRRTFLTPSDELCEIGKRVAKEVGSLCCEVDFIEKEGEYYAIDISIDPNLLLYKELSGKNIANILFNSLLDKKKEATTHKKLGRTLP